MQEQQQEAATLHKAGRIMCNVMLAAAWRGWLAVVDQRHYLQEKLGSALNLFCNKRLTLAWQAWKVGTCAIPKCDRNLDVEICICAIPKRDRNLDVVLCICEVG